MNIWSCVYRECSNVKQLIPAAGFSCCLDDKEYKQEITEILEEEQIEARYRRLTEATLRRIVSEKDLDAEAIQHLLVMRIVEISRLYGRKWMSPIRCFSRGGILDYLNNKIDDDITMAIGNRSGVQFDVLVDILAYLTLYRTVIQWEEQKFSRKMFLNTCAYWLYLLATTVLVASMFWLMAVTVVLARQNGAALFIMSVSAIIVVVHTMIRKKHRENKHDRQNTI